MTRDLWQSIVKTPMMKKLPEKKRQDKKNKLVIAAKTLVNQKGFADTTLADIAQHAEVPLGNVYYYFKTKEAIGLAVIEQRFKEWELWKKKTNTTPVPLFRLVAFLECITGHDYQTDFGAPVGQLFHEMAREGGSLGSATKKFLENFIDWIEEQFLLMGLSDKSKELAQNFFSYVQGTVMLSYALSDSKLIEKQKKIIARWLKQIEAVKPCSSQTKELNLLACYDV